MPVPTPGAAEIGRRPVPGTSGVSTGRRKEEARATLAARHAHGLIVLTLTGNQISAVTRFSDTSVLAHFGLPRTLRD